MIEEFVSKKVSQILNEHRVLNPSIIHSVKSMRIETYSKLIYLILTKDLVEPLLFSILEEHCQFNVVREEGAGYWQLISDEVCFNDARSAEPANVPNFP